MPAQHTHQIPRDQWLEYCDIFTNGNQGRSVRIEIVSAESGDALLVDGAPLLAIDYDPVDKGDTMIVSTGRGAIESSHSITAPTEFWEAQDEQGAVVALEIIDQHDARTIVTFV